VSMYISAAVSVTYVVVGAGSGGRVVTGTAVIAPGRLLQYDISVGTRDGTADSSLSGPGVAVTALGGVADAVAAATTAGSTYGGDGAGVVVVSIPTVAFHLSCLAGSFTSTVVGSDTVVTFTGAGTLQMSPADDSAHCQGGRPCQRPPLGADTMCAALLCTAFFVCLDVLPDGEYVDLGLGDAARRRPDGDRVGGPCTQTVLPGDPWSDGVVDAA